MTDLSETNQVSQVLDFGGGKEDDDPIILPPQPQQPQISILIVVTGFVFPILSYSPDDVCMYVCGVALIQDDIPLDRTITAKLIESEKKGRLQNARLLEADDGATAVEVLRRELSEGRRVDFVLMDYVMVEIL